ncbi:MAG: NAD(P)H-binding protein [Streptosporangiales bacterium]|nr:NAD(P)H-binding protein [Streptosporangiales bacterium]
MITVTRATGNVGSEVVRMAESENLVRASGLDWTILRPSGFMSNALQWVPQVAAGDVVRAPFAGVPIASIDPSDVASVAVEAFAREGHQGRTG